MSISDLTGRSPIVVVDPIRVTTAPASAAACADKLRSGCYALPGTQGTTSNTRVGRLPSDATTSDTLAKKNSPRRRSSFSNMVDRLT